MLFASKSHGAMSAKALAFCDSYRWVDGRQDEYERGEAHTSFAVWADCDAGRDVLL
jgi:hypothetical protein